MKAAPTTRDLFSHLTPPVCWVTGTNPPRFAPKSTLGSGAQRLASEAAMMRNVKVLEREARARTARKRQP